MDEPLFLTIEEVVTLHDVQLSRFGGCAGLRDAGLLASAVAMPLAGFGEHFAHADIFEMAAAYLFHLVQNHPFVDGDKRVGFHAAYTFLRMNGVELVMPQGTAYDLVIATAEGRTTKQDIAAVFREHART